MLLIRKYLLTLVVLGVLVAGFAIHAHCSVEAVSSAGEATRSAPVCAVPLCVKEEACPSQNVGTATAQGGVMHLRAFGAAVVSSLNAPVVALRTPTDDLQVARPQYLSSREYLQTFRI